MINSTRRGGSTEVDLTTSTPLSQDGHLKTSRHKQYPKTPRQSASIAGVSAWRLNTSGRRHYYRRRRRRRHVRTPTAAAAVPAGRSTDFMSLLQTSPVGPAGPGPTTTAAAASSAIQPYLSQPRS